MLLRIGRITLAGAESDAEIDAIDAALEEQLDELLRKLSEQHNVTLDIDYNN